jgi:hypothetical protein
MRAADINALVTSYAAWRGMVAALPIGVFNAIGFGLEQLGLVSRDTSQLIFGAGCAVAVGMLWYDRRAYGSVRVAPRMGEFGALGLLAAFLLMPAVLLLWTGAGYNLREFVAVLGPLIVIALALTRRRDLRLWLVSSLMWLVLLYATLFDGSSAIRGALLVAVAVVVAISCAVERRRLPRLFKRAHV